MRWTTGQPIYRQLRDRVVAMILDGVLKRGRPLALRPHCRSRISGQSGFTSQGISQLVDEKLVRAGEASACSSIPAPGIFYSKANAQKFLAEEWPGWRQHSAPRPRTEQLLNGSKSGASESRMLQCLPKKRKTRNQTMTVIEARGLRKAFGSTIALDGVDLHVEEGRILGIIGPNGAGKSTALNAVLGLIPYQGELRVLAATPGPSACNSFAMSVSFSDVAISRAGCAFRRRLTT